MISEKIYVGDGATYTYQVDWKIPSSSHLNVYVDNVLISVEDYQVINNTIRFNDDAIPANTANITIRVATSPEELAENPSGISVVVDDLSGDNTIGIVAYNIDTVIAVGGDLRTLNTIGNVSANLTSISAIGGSVGEITTVANNITAINTVVANIADINNAAEAADRAELAEDNAGLSEAAAAASALSASGSATTATTQAGIATTAASTATTQAGIATTAAGTATTKAGIATTAAGTATTKAGEASTSASSASISAGNATTSELLASKWATEAEDVVVSGGQYSAFHWAQKAADVVTGGVIDDTAASLVKTYSSSKIVTLLGDKSDTTHTHTTLTGLTVTGLKETSVAMSANNINLATGNLFTKTISGATTLTVSNVPTSGTVQSFILELTNGGAYIITWFSGMKWAGGISPTLTVSGVDILGFYSYDGGTTWKGIVMSKDSK